MPTLVKFCGLTRREDAEEAVRCGASYLGVIFAGGPRMQTASAARALLSGLPAGVKRVGVFGAQSAAQVADVAASAELDVVQLHADPRADDVASLRERFAGEIWGVVRIPDSSLPAHVGELMSAADAVLLDAQVAGSLGGTGVALPWAELAESLASLRARGRVVLAGGLHAGNVGQAIVALTPDVVDVSSGVESAPGIKDHTRLRAFRDAVRAVQPRLGEQERND